ncbi:MULTISPECIES: alpha-amylase family glycosyl hydrolase [unclassified Duganella]|uniref:alpha-amylase family glycosyl hydrolase n=1 Tax=unclassified Duganella TaxID=2636909 RepID=UPI0006FF736B|nr:MULTISPECIES: alpha-amylase family glycosyl hydrolase [unclassified Duganella]KQV54056.1 alpha-amlyase [Duganella sp. Root336D2]KRB98267.1 alpha-amlyase [Duganella sp. Root198D2]
MKLSSLALSLLLATSAHSAVAAAPKPFLWENATVYFLVTDRFANGDKSNDLAYGRKADAAPLRGFMGGDFKGLTAKIKSGYFDDLGVDVIWTTPPVEQVHAGTDEGTGKSYGFHGYWARDFTAVDANLGTEKDFRDFVEAAHARGIRVLLDVVMNHTGPVTEADPVWPEGWVRTEPQCQYKDLPSTVSCTLVKNLPDFRTESDTPVELPPALAVKWKAEGRYEREVKELDDFFARTGYPRAPRYYLMKWHADWVRKYGVDGFRADTAKHVEPAVWAELRKVALAAHDEWKSLNPRKVLGDGRFYMLAEVYNYNIAHGQAFDMGGGEKANYFANGFDGLINFGMVHDAKGDYESLFSKYATQLAGPLKGHSVMNYMDSHDDGNPFDPSRQKPFETANKLLLAPGAAQIYYGDEISRRLDVAEAKGDAKLRSFMNWGDLKANAKIRTHWAKLGKFRQAHQSVGAGEHRKLADLPYTFSRVRDDDKVVVALDVKTGEPVDISVGGLFADGAKVKDAYSGVSYIVKGGVVRTNGKSSTILLSQ